MMRIGFGYDVHRLVPDRKLILGGVEIPHPLGLLGHSDADVLLHALMDAILGALNLGSIGDHFPDTDNQYRGISSIVLLKHVAKLMKGKNFSIENIDTVIAAEEPKIKPYVSKIQECVAESLHITPDRVSVKATTTEKLGFEGRKEGISAYATVLLSRVGA